MHSNVNFVMKSIDFENRTRRTRQANYTLPMERKIKIKNILNRFEKLKANPVFAWEALVGLHFEE